MPNSVSNAQPTLALTELVALTGIFPSRSIDGLETPFSSVALGYLLNFAGNFTIRGTAPADGRLLDIASNTALFSLYGTIYGGDGRTTFALPDLADRLAVSAGNGPGLSNYVQGGVAGSNADFTITESNLPFDFGGSGATINNVQESLPVRYIINLTGTFPSSSGASLDSIGMVHKFAGNFAPRGTAFAEGQLLSIADNSALFSIIGTTYGGDGRTTFALPDLRGRTIVGSDDGTSGNLNVGTVLGSESISLSSGNLPTAIGGSGQSIDNNGPALVMTMLISTGGIFPSRNSEPAGLTGMHEDDYFGEEALDRQSLQLTQPSYGDGSTPYLGQVVAFAGNFIPAGWARADGSLVPINDNQALFSLLGTNFGGDGRTTFGLPDLEGRAIVHADGSAGNRIGDTKGDANIILDINDIPGRTQDGDSNDNTIIGGNENDVFNGLEGMDTLTGNGGDDQLNGGPGADMLDGGPGNDEINGGTGDDNMMGGANDDVLRGNGGNDTIDGGEGNDRIIGGSGNDVILGGPGNDVINGGSGDDNMAGGIGDDVYTVEDAGDVVTENPNEGFDTVRATIDYTLPDNVELLSMSGAARIGTGNGLDNAIFGSGGGDTLAGLAGNDTIRGNNARDTIDGGAGEDRIDGGQGKDIMTGGDDRDLFQFRSASDLNATRGTADVITDFDQSLNERIQLRAIDADINTGANDDFEWISTNAFSGTAGEMRYQQAGSDTFIEGDTNGDGVADIMIRLTGLYTLDATDIVGVSDLQPNVTGGELQTVAFLPAAMKSVEVEDSARISFDSIAELPGKLAADPAEPASSSLVPNTFGNGQDALHTVLDTSVPEKAENSGAHLDPAQLQNAPMPIHIMLPTDELI